MTDYVTVLARRYRDDQYSIVDNDYDTLVWLSNTPKPSQAELDELWDDVLDEIHGTAQSESDARQSALAKLSALGLTDAEIAALVGD